MTQRTQWIWMAMPALFTLLWAGGYIAAKIGLQYAEPMTLLSMRFAAIVMLLVPVYLAVRPDLPKTRWDWIHLSVVGILMQAVYFGFCWWAFKAGVSAGVLAIFMSLQPILVAILAPGIAGEKVGWKRWCGLLLGLLGVLTVILARSDIEPPTIAGIGFSLMGLLGITMGVLYEKRFGTRHHPVTANLIQYLAGFLAVIPVALMTETQTILWGPQLFGALGYLVFGSSLLAMTMLLLMVRAGEVSRVSSLMFLVPPLAALFGWQILDEAMPPLAWAGMLLAALGVFIVLKRKTAIQNKEEPAASAQKAL